jgi:hypothetical protein
MAFMSPVLRLCSRGGEIYGKVVDLTAGPPGLARIRFTSVTPELKAWVTAWSAT